MKNEQLLEVKFLTCVQVRGCYKRIPHENLTLGCHKPSLGSYVAFQDESTIHIRVVSRLKSQKKSIR
jgi:hypothetical protein